MLFKYNLGRGANSANSLAGNIRVALHSGTDTDGLYADGSRFVPPFIAADQEGGLVHRYGNDATRLPAAAAFGSWSKGFATPAERRARLREAVEGSAYLSGRELGLLGMNLNLAPVAETLDDSSFAFLDTRAYSWNGEMAGTAAGAFVRGMRKAGIACVVKHFPGNAAVDPHLGMPVLDLDVAELEVLFVSFGIALRQGNPAALMVSHIMVPALDPKRPASLSPVIIDRVLRKKLQYEGLVVCDDLRMGAIRATGREPAAVAVEALAAGVDLVLTWKEDLALLRDALVAAMEKGGLAEARVRDAARRVIAVKIAYGIYDSHAAEIPESPEAPASIEAELMVRRTETERFLKERGL
jgi:beta-N-acetylhexosaminidase